MKGYVVCYSQNDVDSTPYKGAYCVTQAQPNLVYSDIFAPDFASLYPNSIRSANMCLTTMCDNGIYKVDVSDDVSMGVLEVCFNDEDGLISYLVGNMFSFRKHYKKLASEAIKGSHE